MELNEMLIFISNIYKWSDFLKLFKTKGLVA